MKQNLFRVRTLGGMAGLALLAAISGNVGAVPFDPAISISGSADFDDGFAFVGGSGASQSGSFGWTAGGGAVGPTTYAGTTVTGADPLGATLTDIGDGLSLSATGDVAADPDEVAAAIDGTLTLVNLSLTDTFKITLKVLVTTNTADADGTDSYTESEFVVDVGDDGSDEFFSEVVSDIFFGDELNGVGLGTFGALVSDSGAMTTIDIILAPGASETVAIDYALQVEAFDPASPSTGDFLGSVSIDAVMNLTPPPTHAPAPPTLGLLLGGLVAMGALRRRRNG